MYTRDNLRSLISLMSLQDLNSKISRKSKHSIRIINFFEEANQCVYLITKLLIYKNALLLSQIGLLQ